MIRRELRKSVRGNDGSHGDQRIVSKVHQVAGENASRARAHQRENDANDDKHSYQAERPAQLRSVHQSEQDAGDQDRRRDSK
jgi:hypothetical protein